MGTWRPRRPQLHDPSCPRWPWKDRLAPRKLAGGQCGTWGGKGTRASHVRLIARLTAFASDTILVTEEPGSLTGFGQSDMASVGSRAKWRWHVSQERRIGHKITGEIVGIKGSCGWGHKVGDSFEVSCHNTAGVCGFLYHEMFPDLQMLQFGGTWPWGADANVKEVECPDRHNIVSLRLTRE